MTPPATALDPVLAVADLCGRSGATNFETGYLDDQPPHRWYASAQYKGARLFAEDPDDPTSAADGLAIQILDGGTCTHCHKVIRISPTDRPLRTRKACLWAREGARWIRGCER